MKRFVILGFMLLAFLSEAQEQKGVETITIPNTEESYELFLPSSYETRSELPVIFVFDPYGNGTLGISHFLMDAENFGYVIVATNNTSNGKYAENFEIASRMMTHALSNYKLNESRIYTAGFSGGSRLASAIAVLTKKVRGVIACGSAFSQNPQEKPTFESFQYIGVVGDKDMNYLEFKDAETWLDKFNVKNSLVVFAGAHQWPPREAMHQAFVWLERELNDSKSKENLNEELKSYADNLFAEDNLVEAYNYYRLTEKEWTKDDAMITALSQLKADKNYKTELKNYNKAIIKERQLRIKLIDKFNVDLGHVNLKFWQKQTAKLKVLQSSEKLHEQHMATRVLNQIGVMAIEKGFVLQQQSNFEALLSSAEIGLVLQPKNANHLYMKALALANLNNIDKAKTIVIESLIDGTFNHNRLKTSSLYRRLETELLEDEKYLEWLNSNNH